MSGTAGKNAAVQLLPLIDYTLMELRRCTTGMMVLPSFPSVPLYRFAVVHVYMGWTCIIFDLRARHFFRNGVVVYDTAIYEFSSKMFHEQAT